MENLAPDIPGYEVEREIGQGAMSVVYRARRDRKAYAVKVMKNTTADRSVEAALRFRREAAALARLSHLGLVKIFEVNESQGRPYLVMELVDGEELTIVLKRNGPLPEEKLLALARTLAGALAEVHRRGLVHRDVKPANIIIERSGAAKIIDFGFVAASSDSRGVPEAVGTFLYSAPEQTGMLKRPVDGRADLYALGAVLFECATGRPPFEAETVAELIRMHAAVVAPNAHELNKEVRPIVAAIIAKLLAKDPDDRYQTGEGLLADLERIEELDAGARGGRPLALGSHDVVGGRLYEVPLTGRATELSGLRALWAQVKQGKGAMTLVEGEGGSGKTRLIREMFQAAHATDKALILSGKCQQSERIPFGPFREALDDHVSRIMRMPPPERQVAVDRLKRAAAEVGPVVRRLSRGLEVLLSEGTRSGANEPAPNVERFYGGLVDFLGELAKQHGHALFLVDDVQWLDDASFEVMVRLGQRLESMPLLLAGTARNDPASEAARLKLVDQLGQRLTRIVLAPLSLEAVGDLIAAHLGGHELERSIVEKLTARANGNPFAVGQYVRALLDSGAIRPSDGTWRVDAGRFSELSLPTDVLELVVNRAATLSEKASRVLSLAAVIGMHFDRRLLLRITGEEESELNRVLSEAVGANLVEQSDGDSYVFIHDRVQEALFRNLSKEEQRDVHQTIAEALEEIDDKSTEHVFALARHYSQGHIERNPQRVYETNLAAGQQALASHAYMDAQNFLDRALAALKIGGQQLAGSVDLEEALGRACLGTAKVQDAIEHFQRVLQQARDPMVRTRIHIHLIRVYMQRWDAGRVWAECQRGLQALGQPWFKSPLLQWVSAGWYWLLGWFLEQFRIGYGRSTGPALERRKALSIIYAFATMSAMIGMRPRLGYLTVPRVMVNVHLMGDLRESVEPLHLSAAAGASIGMHRIAMKAISRAVRIAEQLGDRGLLAMVKRNLDWVYHFVGEVRKAEEVAREVLFNYGKWLLARDYLGCCNDVGGNLVLRGYCRSGLELDRLGLDRANKTDPTQIASGNANIRIVTAHTLAVLGEFNEATHYLQEALELTRHLPPDDLWVPGWLAWHRAGFYLEQDELGEPLNQVFAHFEKLGLLPRNAAFHVRPIYVITAHARLRQYLHATPAQKAEARRRLKKALKDLRSACDLQNRCHLPLIEAALARTDGKLRRAVRLLGSAERLAKQYDSPWALFEIQAERARIARGQGDTAAAENEAIAAHNLASEHGWRNRARRIQAEFGLEKVAVRRVGDSARSPSEVTGLPGTTSTRILPERYLSALLEVSLASMSAIEPTEQARAALDEIVRVLGAERAFLFLCDPDTGELLLKGGRDANKQDLREAKGYASTVVNQVKETRKPVVVAGTEEGALLGSQSAVAHDLRSIMAAPLMLRDRLVGVVYLDNHLVKGLFTREDVDILLAISNHIAVAVEAARSARLEVERKALEKEMEVTAAVQSLFLPRSPEFRHGKIELKGFCRPAAKCGGDWWWYEATTARSVSILVGDVTGHGAAPAMVTAAVAAGHRVSRRIREDLALPERLTELNAELKDICRGQYYMTLAAVVIDEEHRRIQYWSAGAPSLLVLKKNGSVAAVPCAGMPLGSEAFALGKVEYPVEPGERIFIFTDGLSELALPNGGHLGMKRLSRIFSALRGKGLAESVANIVTELDAARKGRPQEDDLTFALVDIHE